MSYYTSKWMKWIKEGTWGTYATPTTFANYLLNFDFEVNENQISEFVIAGSRDKRSRAWVEQEVTGRIETQMCSGKWFEYILGSTAGTSIGPFTYSVGTTLPSMSVFTGKSPAEDGSSTVKTQYMGMKVDTAEFTLEQGEDVLLSLDMAGKGATISTSAVSTPTIDYTVEPYTYIYGTLSIGGVLVTNVSRAVLTVNNNLNAEYSCSAQTIHAVALREGGVEIGLRLTVGSNFNTIQSWNLTRTGVTVILGLVRTGGSIIITMPNCAFTGYPDTGTGIEPVTGEFELIAYPSASADAITIVETTGSSYSAMKY